MSFGASLECVINDNVVILYSLNRYTTNESKNDMDLFRNVSK